MNDDVAIFGDKKRVARLSAAIDRVERWLVGIEYLPGWTFVVGRPHVLLDGEPLVVLLRIEGPVLDARKRPRSPTEAIERSEDAVYSFGEVASPTLLREVYRWPIGRFVTRLLLSIVDVEALDRDEFVDLLGATLLEAHARHEIGEWLVVDGERPFDPHDQEKRQARRRRKRLDRIAVEDDSR